MGLFTRSIMSKAIISSTLIRNSLILKRIKKKTFKSMKCSALFLIMLQLEYEYFYEILSWISTEQNGLFVLFLTYCKYFNVFLLSIVLAFRRRIYVYIKYYIIMKLLITLLLGIFYEEWMFNFVKCLPTSKKMKSTCSCCKISNSLICYCIVY